MVVLSRADIDYFSEIRKKNVKLYNHKLEILGLKDSDIPWNKVRENSDPYLRITFSDGVNDLDNPDRFLYGDYKYWYEDYCESNETGKNTKEIHKKKNTIVLIDAESIGANKCPSIIGQAKKVGEIAEVRYFARQNDKSTRAWKDMAKKYNVKPILCYGEPEHNKIDKLIIKHAKKILRDYKSIDIFCIASRDGDFAELTDYLRNQGKRVIILATKNTSQKLKNVSSEVKGI